MKHYHALEKHNLLLKNLTHLPKKIVLLYSSPEHTNIPEFVLHDFCDETCFGLSQAAYFVDNPDFNCFKGVAGVCKNEAAYCMQTYDIWQEPEKYASCMQESPFNQKVRTVEHASIAHKSEEKEALSSVARELGFSHYDYYKWPMKHGNHGFLIFEHTVSPDNQVLVKEHLPQGVYLLSLCPIS